MFEKHVHALHLKVFLGLDGNQTHNKGIGPVLIRASDSASANGGAFPHQENFVPPPTKHIMKVRYKICIILVAIYAWKMRFD